MKKYNILVLTDHLTHTINNSVYEICAALRLHPQVERIHCASRGNRANDGFFYHHNSTELEVWSMRDTINYEEARSGLVEQTVRVDARYYDVVWLRLPRPIPDGFFDFLTRHIDESRIINRPAGIVETSNKAFLLNFPDLCPPIKHCRTIDDIREMEQQYPIVLKPVESYGGKGVVKVARGQVYHSTRRESFKHYQGELEGQLAQGGYLAMKYLKNVRKGDKRIVVVNGAVVGAVLRLPPKGSWICNASQGGSAVFSKPDEDEITIIQRLNEELLPRGIAMYGIDTLMGDNNRRILSEVNTLSIGGIKPMAELSGLPLVQRTADLLMEYVVEQVSNRRRLLVA